MGKKNKKLSRSQREALEEQHGKKVIKGIVIASIILACLFISIAIMY